MLTTRDNGCPSCGRPLPPDAPEGNCPACLLQMVMTVADAMEAPAGPESPASPAPIRTNAPRSFGDFELLGEIARGGMGIVYRARQIRLNRLVALKMILADQLVQPAQVVRFHTEARAAARLDHPHIVPIHEIGELDGRHFFTMKLMEGGTLAQRLAQTRTPLPPREAAALMAPVARAVHFAHQHGVLHRDLKPSNILLDAHGSPHVADFGLARLLEDTDRLTRTQVALGSPAYMAPEQAVDHPRELTTAADLYSLGAILYELLTGRPPILGSTPLETLRQVVEREPVDPRRYNPNLDADLATICLKCLEKAPARRYASAAELADELDRRLTGRPIHARPAGPLERARRWSRRQPVLATLVAAVALLLFALSIGASIAAWRIDQARLAEKRERQTAVEANANLEQANARLAETVTSLEWQRAEESFRTGDPGRGLAQFAAVLRRHPNNSLAAERILSALLHRSWVLPDGPSLRHLGRVFSATFSPDGQFLVTGCHDRHARVWDAQARREIARFEHPDDVRGVCFSPDGRWIATACSNGEARVYDWRTRELIAGPLRHNSWVFGVCFSPDGERLVTTSGDHTARIWNSRNGALLQTLVGHTDQVWQGAFSPDGRLVATASYDQTARLWDAHTGLPHGPTLQHTGRVFSVAFSPDGTRVATASRDRVAGHWRVETGAPILPALRNTGGLNDVRFDPNGLLLAAAGYDNNAQLWNLRSGSPTSQLLRHLEQINQVAFDPVGPRLATAGDDWVVRFWDLRPSAALQLPLQHPGAVTAAAFSPDGNRLITAAADGTARLWDATTGAPVTGPLPHPAPLRTACFSPDGRWVATGAEDGSAWIWEALTGSRTGAPFRHAAAIQSVTFSPNGHRLLCASDDRTAQVWDVDSRQPVGRPLRHGDRVVVARFSTDGSLVVTASSDSTARVWDARSGAPITPPLGHIDKIVDARFSPDGTRVATASMDNSARLWDARTGAPIGRLLQHVRTVEQVAFSPDGSRVATASLDHTARIWDAHTGSPLTPPLTHDEGVISLDFSPDGQRLATAATDGIARLWDVRTGLPRSDRLEHPSPVVLARFSPNGQSLLTATSEPQSAARIWRVPTAPQPFPDWLPAFAETVAGVACGEQDTTQIIPESRFLQLTQNLREGPDTNLWTHVAHWFLADRMQRPLSPFDTTPTRDYVDQRAQDRTASSLEEALRLDPTNALALARLAQIRLGPGNPTSPADAAEAACLARRALRFSPELKAARDLLERISHSPQLAKPPTPGTADRPASGEGSAPVLR